MNKAIKPCASLTRTLIMAEDRGKATVEKWDGEIEFVAT
jgi:hypothetical protein